MFVLGLCSCVFVCVFPFVWLLCFVACVCVWFVVSFLCFLFFVDAYCQHHYPLDLGADCVKAPKELSL